jgi:hypothetical protein
MATRNAQQLMAGFSAFTTAGEVAASRIEGEAVSITITPSTFPCATPTTTPSVTTSVDAMLDSAH